MQVWQLPRILSFAAALTVAVAATGPEGAHGDDAHAPESLTIPRVAWTLLRDPFLA